MNLIRQMNQLAQESANHDRTQIAQIAVVINPRSTMYLRDDSKLYSTLNLQQMHLVYPRIGAPHDRIMIDDLAKARDYDLYIVQDCLLPHRGAAADAQGHNLPRWQDRPLALCSGHCGRRRPPRG